MTIKLFQKLFQKLSRHITRNSLYCADNFKLFDKCIRIWLLSKHLGISSQAHLYPKHGRATVCVFPYQCQFADTKYLNNFTGINKVP